jgi:hypothetical protein
MKAAKIWKGPKILKINKKRVSHIRLSDKGYLNFPQKINNTFEKDLDKLNGE